MIKDPAPVVLFVYNRPGHTIQTLEALSNNHSASKSTLFIYSDGPKADANPEEYARIEQVRQVIRLKPWCKEVIIREYDYNKGLADSIVDGVTEVVNKHNKVIVLEDDVITSPGFLEYMNNALDLYENEEKVMHISGYMYPHEKKLPETFFFNVPYPGGGWATWYRAWRNFNNDTEYLYNYFNTAKGWWKFNKYGGDYLQRQLILNLKGELKTWFIKWHSTLLIQQGYTLYPCNSLTTNIGFDASGSHCSIMNKFDIEILANKIDVKKIQIIESKLAKTVVLKFYQGPFSLKKYVYSILLRFLKKESLQKLIKTSYKRWVLRKRQ